MSYVIENFEQIGTSSDVYFNKIKFEGRNNKPSTQNLKEDEAFLWLDSDVDKVYITGQGGTNTELLTKSIFGRSLTFRKGVRINQNLNVLGNFSGSSATLSSMYIRSVNLPNTTSDNVGVIFKDGSRFLHDFTQGSGSKNLFLGNGAGNFTMDSNAVSNIGIGNSALLNNTNGYQNNAFGNDALRNNTAGFENNALGNLALKNNISGNRNLALGDFAGVVDSSGISITNPENSIFIGYSTRSLGQGENNQIVIGNEAIGVGSNSIVLGNDSILKTILKGNLGLGTTNPSYKLDVNGSAATTHLYLTQLATGAGAITLCRNVSTGLVGQCTSSISFKRNVEALGLGLTEVMQLRPVRFDWKDGSGEDFGFIAEEVYAVSPLLAEYSTEGEVASVRYKQLTALLANAIQEQQLEFEGLSNAVGSLNVTQMQNIYDQFVEVAENLAMSTENGSLVINSSLTVIGDSLFNNATFTGDVNVGQIKIDSLENDLSIDAASCVDMDGNLNKEACEANKLSIMNNKAGNVEFFDGKAVISPNGEVLGEKVEAKTFKSTSSSTPSNSDTCSPKEFKFGEEDGKAYIFYCTSESKWVRTELNSY